MSADFLPLGKNEICLAAEVICTINKMFNSMAIAQKVIYSSLTFSVQLYSKYCFVSVLNLENHNQQK